LIRPATSSGVRRSAPATSPRANASLGVAATSDEPIHRQFREFVKDVHGVDLANDPPPDVRLISDTSF
jgi:hypothetical protein